jgi:gas vesicle protein
MARDNNSGDGIVWFVAGAALGVLGALLYAPDAGEHTRRKIGEAARTGASKVSESGRDLYERGRKLADDATAMMERGRKLIDNPELGEEA